jgi:hypothetical protein
VPTGIAVFTVTVTANFEVLRRIVSPSTAGRDHSDKFDCQWTAHDSDLSNSVLTTRSLTVPTEPGVRVAASPWAWDRRQPLGRGILVTASRSALSKVASQVGCWPAADLTWRSHSENLATAASLRASLRAMWYSPGARALESPTLSCSLSSHSQASFNLNGD